MPLPVLLIDGFSPLPSSMRLLAMRFHMLGIVTSTVSLNFRVLRALRDLETFADLIDEAAEELCARAGTHEYVILGYSAGSVAALFLQKRGCTRRAGLRHRARAMVSLAGPHDGSWVSVPALLTLPISRISAQLLPDSDFLRALHRDPIPHWLRVLCIGGSRDLICRGKTVFLPGAERLVFPMGHLRMLWDGKVFDAAKEFLYRAP